MSDGSEEPKIVVDDDWKERVRAERDAARVARQAQERSTEGQAPRPDTSTEVPSTDHFTMLVSMLATQAMVALGKIPDPIQGHAVVRPSHARQAIDLLAMLEQKTKGNLTPDEARMLSDLLHEMRMIYLAVYKSPQDSSTQPPEEDTPPTQEDS